MHKILITGALGQIGSDISVALAEIYGQENILLTDIKDKNEHEDGFLYEKLDVNNEEKIKQLIEKHKITQVYHLAAMLSATAEKYPVKGWELNTNSLLFFLELAKEKKIKQIFWPSSIAVFGPDAQTQNTPQNDVKNPTSMYGIAKVAGESFCQMYHDKFGVDVRSIRFPGLISYKTKPGGGTTDYAVDIYYKALENGEYTSFLSENSTLPMLYMKDAVRATVELMQAPAQNLSIWTSYNLAGMSFSPKEIANEIKKHLPDFKINYSPDYRQNIADSWPNSINDEIATKDWNWKPAYDLESMTEHMLQKLQQKLSISIK